MRLVTIRTPDGTHAGRVDGDAVVELPQPDVGALLGGSDWRRVAEAADGRRHDLGAVDLAPVVVAPRKIICLGLNYEPHIREMGRDLPEHPTLFAKFARALVGPRDPIVLPPESRQVDWEAEFAFVVGREARRARGDDAAAAVAGYCVLNDVSMRDWQYRSKQWLAGKTFERSTPVGPWLVTPDELPGGDGAPDLEIRCEVDGDVRQLARTGDLLFSPTEIVEYVSSVVALEPGDLVATGTPGGVGVGRDPQVFLEPGQVVRTAVEGIGELVNTCVEEEA